VNGEFGWKGTSTVGRATEVAAAPASGAGTDDERTGGPTDGP
jgi:hypothetical protein